MAVSAKANANRPRSPLPVRERKTGRRRMPTISISANNAQASAGIRTNSDGDMAGSQSERDAYTASMKTILRLALTALLLSAACACGNKGDLVLPDRPEPAALR